MKSNYESPRVTVYGSVQNLTGLVGQGQAVDGVFIDGEAQEDFEEGTARNNCTYATGSAGTLVFTGDAGDQQSCEDIVNDGDGLIGVDWNG